jgi:hypothetical protein
LWRDTARPARFWGLDARASFPLVLSILKVSKLTFGLAFVCVLIFWFVEKWGMTFPSSLRALRSWIASPHRPAVPDWTKRRRVDYGINPEREILFVDRMDPATSKAAIRNAEKARKKSELNPRGGTLKSKREVVK